MSMRMHTKRLLTAFVTLAVIFTMSVPVLAKSPDPYEGMSQYKYKKSVIAYRDGSTYYFQRQGSAKLNRQAINKIVKGNKPKTLVFTSDVPIDTYIYPGNNTTIDASKYTITSNRGVILNHPSKNKLNYDSMVNITIRGGIWKNSSKQGHKKTMMRFAHASNISVSDATVYTNYIGHGIELIGCKNVKVTNCKLYAIGKNPKGCVEEQLQIDLASKATAPGLIREVGTVACNGHPCKNVTVKDCTIKGARAVNANWTRKEANFRRPANYHDNINIIHCTLTGKGSEALTLFNTKTATVKNCKISTNAKVKRGIYSTGCHIEMTPGKGPKLSKKQKIVVTGNTIKGGQRGLFVFSKNGKKFGTVKVTANKVYAKSGKKNAIRVDRKVCKKRIVKHNKMKKW